ncbi:MAG TPA: hypothetical protein VH165_12765 [Kofleriaceae bacterium]|jgi:hypothetical protein|nr:hypothetical protein [Kofleriaceae bacterium]
MSTRSKLVALPVVWMVAAFAACSVSPVTYSPVLAPVSVGGTVTGLVGDGLVLTDSGGDDLAVSANGTFVFLTPVARGAGYDVAVKSQPSGPSQLCAVSAGTGTTSDQPVTDIQVNCSTSTFTVSGTVSGLVGTGLVLQNNAADSISVSADGSFTFPTPLVSGASYLITAATQPTQPSQQCSINGAGTVADANITDVTVICSTSAFTIGGTVTGLAGGGLVLQNNGGDDLPISADGTFAFTTPVASGAMFAVTVASQPSGPTQTCEVTGGSGTVGGDNVASVVINCATDRFLITGSVSGLIGTVTLQNNGGDNLDVTATGQFAFPTSVASGATYSVTVLTQPSGPAQTCTVTNGAGTVGGADVTDVQVTCATNRYHISGTLSGLAAGDAITLRDNGADDLARSANGTFTFATTVVSGQPYAVTVVGDPLLPVSQHCTVTNGSGMVDASDITNVQVTCTTNSFTIGGQVTGLAGTGLVLRNNGGNDLSITGNGGFTFTTPIASGAAFSVGVATQPSGPTQTCTITAGTGTVGTGNVTTVMVNCAINRYVVGGVLSGLAGGTLTLQNNGGDDLALTTNGAFAFATTLPSGTTYGVTVKTQPGSPSQTCTVSAGSGTVVNADITSVRVTCTVNKFAITGTLGGLAAGDSIVLRDNGGDDVPLSGNGNFAFATPIASGQPYAVTVVADPSSPIAQHCTVTNGNGTVGGGPVNNVIVSCTTRTFTIGGTVSGVISGGPVLQDNGGDNLTITGNGSFTFATPIASGQTYAVTVLSNPAGRACFVTNGTGTVGAGNITSVNVSCVAETQFSEFFPAGPTTQALCNPWLAFTSQLVAGSYNTITLSGSADPVGTTCAVPAMATQICQALHTGASLTVSCGGHNWSVGDCGLSTELNVDISVCTCTTGTQAAIARPCIDLANGDANPNWGGVRTDTCDAPSQTITVTCQ